MQKKPLIIFFILLGIAVIGFFTAFLFNLMNRKEPIAAVATREPSITINQTIEEAITIYASSPYRLYSGDELRKYFVSEIANEILRIYEPINDPYEEKPLDFEEQPLPVIGSIWITKGDGYYAVKLQFGEVFYNYRVKIAPNRIITEITDWGITFE